MRESRVRSFFRMAPRLRGACVLLLVLACAPAFGQVAERDGRWVGTWATALVARRPSAPAPAGGAQGQGLTLSDQTLRQIAHISLGGNRVRVVFSNAFGTAPLQIGAAHVALRDQGARITPQSARALSFAGRPTASVAPGAVLVSDAVSLNAPAGGDLVIDLYLPGDLTGNNTALSSHLSALQTNFVSTQGNHSGETDLPVATTSPSFFFLARVEVAAAPGAGAVVAFGDSITDGTRSTRDTNNRWPDALARRIASAGIEAGVLNAGIAGNQVLADGAGTSALARFDRDALVQAGVRAVIVLEGINDIGIARSNASPGADDIIAGYRQLIARAHSQGIRVFGATLTPFEGAGTFTVQGEAKRQAVNDFVRNGREFDGVVDFDAAVRDPESPSRIRPEFNPGDSLHMNDAGYQAMGAAIDLELLRSSLPASAQAR